MEAVNDTEIKFQLEVDKKANVTSSEVISSTLFLHSQSIGVSDTSHCQVFPSESLRKKGPRQPPMFGSACILYLRKENSGDSGGIEL